MYRLKISFLALVCLPVFLHSQTILNEDIFKLSRILSTIDNYYVDTVNKSRLTETAIVAMLKELDPHSYYITKKEMLRVNEDMSGEFEGVGVQFNILNDTLIVVTPITGGPAEKAGIISGDRVITVDNENIAGNGITDEQVFKLLRGQKGSKVELGIKRIGIDNVETYTVTRDKIPIYSLDAAYMAGKNTGYIKLNRFSATTTKEYREAIKKLKSDGARHLILDLTNNGGGYMNMAVDIADDFLDGGKMIVYSEGLRSPKEENHSTSRGNMLKGKVIIMVDEGSASASEIVAGAIQDWDRGVIVGRRTFGKGLVQKQYALPDGSAMRLTIARYHTPTGRVVQRPYQKNDSEYHKETSKRYEKGELFSADSINFPDSLKYTTLTLNRTVYGGGGIMPDIFIPIDTTGYSPFYRKIIRTGTLYQFSITYLDTHRDTLKEQYKTADSFIKNFKVDTSILDELLTYAKKNKLTPEENDMERSGTPIAVQLKALLARNLFDQNAFFKIINTLDPIYRSACEIIQDNNTYDKVLLKK